jgi:hypothetical protein
LLKVSQFVSLEVFKQAEFCLTDFTCEILFWVMQSFMHDQMRFVVKLFFTLAALVPSILLSFKNWLSFKFLKLGIAFAVAPSSQLE